MTAYPSSLGTRWDQFNAEFIRELVAKRSLIEAKKLVSLLTKRMKDEGGHLYNLLPLHLLFDAGDAAALASVARQLVAIQTKILTHLAQTVGRSGILDLFHVPPQMRRFVNWDELLNPKYLIGRFDILQTTAGYWFCEFNIDSCVAGAELFEFMCHYFDLLELPLKQRFGIRSPLEDLSTMIGEFVRDHAIDRVVILDWSVGGGSPGKGYLTYDYMRSYLAGELHPIPVFIADEKTYDPAWLHETQARQTLVHRGFMMTEMDDEGRFLDQLLRAGTRVFSTFEAEIRMDKGWFSLLHQNGQGCPLTEPERSVISTYLPFTCNLDPNNLNFILSRKEDYIFKQKRSFGGAGIYIGEETSVQELRAAFDATALSEWTAQKLLNPVPANFPSEDSFRLVPQNVVFGLYLYGPHANGMFLRASERSRVVNVTSGKAKAAWASCVSAETRDRLVACLSRLN
jgi:hypothetical protein